MVYGEGPIPARGPVHGGYRDARGRQIVPAPMAPAHATPAEHGPRSAFPEIDCVRDWLPRPVVADAERRASAVGVGAERVLISSGVISEDRYFYALSHWLGLGYETFEQRTRESCPLDDHQLLEAAKSGLLPLRIRGQTEFVVAPRSVPQLVDFVLAHPRVQVRLTSTRRLNQFIAHHSRKMLGYRAAGALTNIWPHLSAASRTWRPLITLAAVFSIALALLIVFPDPTLVGIETILATGFLAWLMLRWFGSFVSTAPRRLRQIPDHLLPFYTIIVPLYGEARSVGDLVNSLRALSYPPEKLDIKFIVEPDDVETSVVLKLRAPFEIITAPSTGPRTKPKALNAALPFALGTFIVVYDAEDRPEPDQLQRAVEAFQTEPDNVACVQARLTIDNTADGWLASLFTAEYAAQFDLFLPGLAALKLPLPLGGSSNHFRTAVLRRIGAWDSYNVTEDADLGMRLARFGYRSMVIHSTTYEEAPARLRGWLCQRTRWFKGWMQTWAVHMRSPRRLLKELGVGGFLTFQLVVGGNVLAALVHPIFLTSLIYAIASGTPILPGGISLIGWLAWLYWITLGAGYLTTIILGLRGLARRRLLSAAWALAFVAVHWLLLSLAAWRALYQLVRNPQGWEKTEHGLARTSRLANMTRSAALNSAFRGGSRERKSPLQAAE